MDASLVGGQTACMHACVETNKKTKKQKTTRRTNCATAAITELLVLVAIYDNDSGEICRLAVRSDLLLDVQPSGNSPY